jgi:putative peptidoglycan lipid II flippase
MIRKFLNIETKNITLAAIIISVSSLASRILGLIRDRLLAGEFGAGSDLDVYFAAFRIPDFIYNILIAGGVVVAFMPLFSEYFLKNKKEAWEFVSNILNVFLFFLVAVSVLAAIFAPVIMKIITPGFTREQIDLAVFLTRILFFSPIFFGLSSIFSGILQYFNRFVIYSLAPIFYNLGIIFGIVLLAPKFGIFGVVLGVIIGAFLHMAVQIPSAVHCGFFYKKIFNLKDPKIKRVFSLMIPRTFGVAVPQINLMVVTAISSMLPTGALSVFTFANNLQQFPQGLIGIPFAVAVFPALSQAWAMKNKQEFLQKFSDTFKKIIFIAVPLSILIFVFRTQIISLVLSTGRFTADSVTLAAGCLGLFSIGIFASCLLPLIFRAYFAFQDTKTPTIIAAAMMFLNVGLCLGFVHFLSYSNVFSDFIAKLLSLNGTENISVIGLPLAFSIDSIIQFFVLLFCLSKKIREKEKIILA